MLSLGRESERRKKSEESVMSRLDGLVIDLELLCPVVLVSGLIFSSRAKLSDFF